MAVIDLNRTSPSRTELHELIPHFARAARGSVDCFFCGQPQTSPAIQWAGSTGEIFLHPACVIELSLRLFRDVHELECRSDLYITARTLPELRSRLRAEESR